MELHDKQFELFITKEKVQNRVITLGKMINEKYHNKNPLFIITLNGAFIFGADLIRQFSHPCETEFIKLKSYTGTESQTIKEFLGFHFSVSGRHVIIIEDIVDSGKTLQYLYEHLQALQPASLYSVAMLQKQMIRARKEQADLVGFEIPDVFVVGYGLDYDGLGRNLEDVWKVRI